ncbi:MAG: DNA polymerase III subunit delta' [Thiomonas sp.]
MNSAWLIHAPQGFGKWRALRQAAHALLCESPVESSPAERAFARLPAALAARRACGHCASCALAQAGTHPDLLIAAPEALWPELGLNPPEEGATRSESKTASQDIRIEQIRRLNEWAVSTSHRGRAKVALVYPADALNPAAANALLKTLEEPPDAVQFLLGAHRLDALLPTIRSRCRQAPMPRPSAAEAQRTIGDSAAQAQVLAWCQGAIYQTDPASGLEWAESLLGAVSRSGASAGSTALPPPPDYATGVSALLKIGSDLQRVQAGAAALYLPQQQQALTRLAQQIAPARLSAALRELAAKQRLAGFPLNQALASDALLLEFAQLFSTGD